MKKYLILSCLAIFALAGQAQWRINGKYLPEPVLELDTENPKYGYAIYEEDGPGKPRKFKLWLNYQFDDASPFVEPGGIARVKMGDYYGFISTTGVLVIRYRFEQADHFNEKGYCRVVENGKYGVIDMNGNYAIPNRYDSMDDLFNGWYEVSRDGEWGYVHVSDIYVTSYGEYQKKLAAGLGY